MASWDPEGGHTFESSVFTGRMELFVKASPWKFNIDQGTHSRLSSCTRPVKEVFHPQDLSKMNLGFIFGIYIRVTMIDNADPCVSGRNLPKLVAFSGSTKRH